jgi:hypothetical protein
LVGANEQAGAAVARLLDQGEALLVVGGDDLADNLFSRAERAQCGQREHLAHVGKAARIESEVCASSASASTWKLTKSSSHVEEDADADADAEDDDDDDDDDDENDVKKVMMTTTTTTKTT